MRDRRPLLSGERVDDYLQEAGIWLECLRPTNDGEAEIVLDIVDVRIRLGRVELAEKRLVVEAAQVELASNREAEHHRLVEECLQALQTRRDALEPATSLSRERLTPLLPTLLAVSKMLKAVEHSRPTVMPGLAEFEVALKGIDSTSQE